MSRTVSPEKKQAIIERLKAGDTHTEIKKNLHASSAVIQRTHEELGLPSATRGAQRKLGRPKKTLLWKEYYKPPLDRQFRMKVSGITVVLHLAQTVDVSSVDLDENTINFFIT